MDILDLIVYVLIGSTFATILQYDDKIPFLETEWFQRYWTFSLAIVFVYIVIVFIGQKSNNNSLRQPSSSLMKRLLSYWNLMLTIFSICGAYRVGAEFIQSFTNGGLITEMGDTMFLLVEKKPVRFIHWVHHAITMVYSIYIAVYLPAVGRWMSTMNFIVHSLMYGYYFITSLGIRLPRKLAMFITTLQVVQMFIGFGVMCSALIAKHSFNPECQNGGYSVEAGLSMMDITPIFFQIIANNDVDQKMVEDARQKNNVKSQFNTKLSELVASVTCLRDYLINNKKDYINIYNSILSMASTMTDEERDQIDKDVQDFVKLSSDVIKILKVESKKSNKSKQQFEHQTNAICLVENYIKSILEFHNKQKAFRLRRNLDSQNYFRLSKSIKGVDSNSNGQQNNNSDDNMSKTNGGEGVKNLKGKPRITSKHKTTSKNKSTKNILNDHCLDIVEPSQENDYSHGLTAEEIQVFKDEGVRMYDQMNSMADEVKTIGKKLTEIAKLQEAFSENVLKQEMDLGHLNTSTITSTEYIREGNEQLRDAMRKNAGFRVMILFFITTLAFVVLFLDWYND
ncbi:hypothetical protein RDWZM_005915 [Blomia tropicalis]|uniref:Very-long-chain 3-oxoacyl-CoA synthase n=1 Tax=Blomia tropicalis TaxID=40697 RepID=A0A9Q0RLA0_BLOTA|nr:hypothetical protein RDWZM_005915 [Blomia tropicalis]